MEAKEMKRKIIQAGIASLYLEGNYVGTFAVYCLSKNFQWDVEENSIIPGIFDLNIDNGLMIVHFDQVK